MSENGTTWSRRKFVLSLAAAGAVTPLALAKAPESIRAPQKKTKLGFDHFSIRNLGWKPSKLVDYAASLKVDTLLVSDLNVFESHDDAYLKNIQAQAKEKRIEVQVGTGSICPTSKSYNAKKWGSAEDHARLLIRIARALDSPVARCYLGSRRDREGDGGIYRHIEETVKICKSVRNQALDAGVKIAIENHAGDMQAWELVSLMEAAGTDYVGATMDSGNATWTLEDPMINLKILGPYAVTTGLRDSAVWETEQGASVMWANMGKGVVDWKAYVREYQELCPDVPFVLEILSYSWQRDLPYLDPQMWKMFPRARAHEFARFVALAKRGEKYKIPEGRPKGARSKELTQQQQKFDLEQSIQYCRDVLGLGLKE